MRREVAVEIQVIFVEYVRYLTGRQQIAEHFFRADLCGRYPDFALSCRQIPFFVRSCREHTGEC